ncbi:hypothetical protein RFI_34645 [Reticulomyxa filosa]|uniref:Uncharacterized protein n=1 Tax=Reticulomyxa filosa TaxID=46433 RepID=X6LMC6_RETFI|nr:hypothetical protein RFI_34645 [Reticulomyxa filosa]|eukprot:ETO02769.1 hypothetical protein RFI_34645 [Reticulomyxa filosa]
MFITDLINDRVYNENTIPSSKNRREFKCSDVLTKLGTFNQRNRQFIFVVFDDIVLYMSLVEPSDTNKIVSPFLLCKKRQRTNRSDSSSALDVRSLLCFENDAILCLIHNILPIDQAFSINFASSTTSQDFTFAVHLYFLCLILSSVESFYVQAPNLQLKTKWVSTLEECIERQMDDFDLQDDCPKSKAPATLFVPDHYSNKCMIESCEKTFVANSRGRIVKFHCKCCGRLICEACGRFEMSSWNRPDITIRFIELNSDECKDSVPIADDTKNEDISLTDVSHSSKKIRKNDVLFYSPFFNEVLRINQEEDKVYKHRVTQPPNQNNDWTEMNIESEYIDT